MPRGARAGWQRARGACYESLAYNIDTYKRSIRIRRSIANLRERLEP